MQRLKTFFSDLRDVLSEFEDVLTVLRRLSEAAVFLLIGVWAVMKLVSVMFASS